MFHEIFARLNFEVRRRLWEDIRLRELKKILSHAARNTEYWRDTLLSTGVDSKNLTFATFKKLPIVTRAFIKELGNNPFIAEGMPENRRLPAHTSGSTGEPFVFYQDTRELLKRRLNILYGLGLHDVRLRRPALISGHDNQPYLKPLGRQWSDLRNKKNRFSILYPMLERLNPEVLFCPPSYLKLFYECLRQDGKMFSFKMIYCAGESMYREDRKRFSSAFKSKIAMWYGTREMGPIAVECAAQNYHLLPWSHYVEIVNSDGVAVNEGEEGDIVVTSFCNYVMPFIRYKTGDRGTILPDSCRCGSNISVVKLAGRMPIIVKPPGGKAFAISEIDSTVALQFAAAILQFQLVEEKPGKYIFRFVASDRYAPEINALLLKALYKITGERSKIILEKVQAILPSASGKTPVFLSNV